MANFRPVTMSVAAADSGVALTNSIQTDSWGMFLLKGTALNPTGGAMQSGAVQVWESSKATTLAADHTTFTDAQGRYGVTCRAGVALKIKFLGK